MATTTPNYGWAVPTSTDLVKDGATAIETLGDSIDASMFTALGTKKAGMVLLNTTSFSAVANQALSSSLSATYKNYRILINISTATLDTDIFLRLRNGVTDKTTNYNYGVYGRMASGAGSVVSASGTTTGLYIGSSDPITTNNNGYVIDLMNPFATDRTIGLAMYHTLGSDTNFYALNSATVQTDAYSADGINLVASAGAITGEISLYGYNR
jgi:hypothetical protein